MPDLDYGYLAPSRAPLDIAIERVSAEVRGIEMGIDPDLLQARRKVRRNERAAYWSKVAAWRRGRRCC